MKKTLIIIILSSFVMSNLHAQIKTTKTVKNDKTINQIIVPQTPPSNTKTVIPVDSKHQKLNTTNLSQPMMTNGAVIQKLPDLKITSISITKLSSSPYAIGLTKYTYEVSYTIMNDGNEAIDAKFVFVSGAIDYEDARVYRPIAGCGNSLTSISGNMINPGATMSSSFRCYGVTLENSRKYIYYLTVHKSNNGPELNEQNNTAQISILFQ